MTITCQQFLEWISDYVDGDLDPALTEAVREHARICAPCVVVLDTTQTSLRLLGDDRNFALPAGASARMRAAIEHGLEEPLLSGELRAPAALPVSASSRRGWFTWQSSAGRWQLAGLAAAVVLVAALGVMRWRTTVVTASGWLVDQHCMSTYITHPQDHPKDCLLKCADSVYGILDRKGRFTPFDRKANPKVVAALKASRHHDHFWATVKATRPDGDDGGVLQVEQIALTTEAR